MTERVLPGIGLTGFWDQGAPWKVGGDQNWLLSSVLTQLGVVSATTSLPASPLNGVIYIVPVGDPNANQVAARDNGAWVYMPPSEGWTAYVRDTEQFVRFDGAVWAPPLAPPAGAGQVGYSTLEAYVAGTIGRKLKILVAVTDAPFNAVGDGVTDDTAAVQAAIDYVTATGSGRVLVPGRFLVGDLVVPGPNVIVSGRSTADGFIVKHGTLGIKFEDSYSWCENMTQISQGTRTDGNNTRGTLHSKGVGSTGHIYGNNVIYDGFSGVPFEGRNLIHSDFNMALFIRCAHGPVIEREAPGGANFSTTVNISNWYVIACGDGGDINYLYESKVHFIVEDCDAPLQITAGRFIIRAWLEDNSAGGINITDAIVSFDDLYSKGVNDTVVRNWTPGVIAAAERGYREFKNMDVTAKRLGLLAKFGVDPQYFAGVGDSVNIGASYAESLVPLVRGRNLIDPTAWVSNRLAEFGGWDSTHFGFKISGVGAGDLSHGLTQNVTVSTAKRYVIDFSSTTISGAPLSNLRCGALTVTNGVPFTPLASGALAVKAFGIGALGVAFESYVTAFSISEVAVDSTLIPLAQVRLSAPLTGRGVVYRTTAPTTGVWGLGEVITNPAPTPAAPVERWTCVATPATFRPTSWMVGMGATGSRPVLAASDVGVEYLDTTLSAAGTSIKWNGSAWVAGGVVV